MPWSKSLLFIAVINLAVKYLECTLSPRNINIRCLYRAALLLMVRSLFTVKLLYKQQILNSLLYFWSAFKVLFPILFPKFDAALVSYSWNIFVIKLIRQLKRLQILRNLSVMYSTTKIRKQPRLQAHWLNGWRYQLEGFNLLVTSFITA